MHPLARSEFNTVKRFARAASADDLLDPPKYGSPWRTPYRDHQRWCPAEEPDVRAARVLAEIRALGSPRNAKLLVHNLSQGRADPERTPAIRQLAAATWTNWSRPARRWRP
jgi:hypothetical protein